MFLKRWSVIAVLAVVGLGLLAYWMSLDVPPPGVTPQGDQDSVASAITAIAGALTTLGGAVFGLLSKWTDHRKAQLEVASKELELEQKRRAAQAQTE
jgi:hypothetical protein